MDVGDDGKRTIEIGREGGNREGSEGIGRKPGHRERTGGYGARMDGESGVETIRERARTKKADDQGGAVDREGALSQGNASATGRETEIGGRNGGVKCWELERRSKLLDTWLYRN